MLAALVLGIGFGTFLQFLPVLTARRGVISAGAAYAAYGGAIILTRLATARWQNAADRRRLLWPTFPLLAAGLGCLALARSPAPAFLGAALVAISSGVLHPGLLATAVELVPGDGRARAISSIYVAFDLGIGMGVWMLTPVFEWFGV